ncbi:hypothetical protein ACQ4PT_041612 [Festuca glaucescens]
MEPPSLCGRRRPWQDLPSELLGLVLLRIPSHASRVRLRSVCSPWRAAARMQSPLPPLLPWLALRDGAFLSLPDGELHHRVVVQDDHVAHRLSTGSMLFLVNSNEGCSLLNPLSWEKTAPRIVNLQCLSTRPGILLEVDNIRKVVVVSDQVTAVRTGNKMYFTNLTILDRRSASSNLVCRWIPASHTYSDYILDIALFQEKLYVLATSGLGAYHLRLYVVDIIGDKPISINCVFSTPNQWETYGFPHYLVASGDRLLMVKQSWKVHTSFRNRVLCLRYAGGGGRDGEGGGAEGWREDRDLDLCSDALWDLLRL